MSKCPQCLHATFLSAEDDFYCQNPTVSPKSVVSGRQTFTLCLVKPCGKEQPLFEPKQSAPQSA